MRGALHVFQDEINNIARRRVSAHVWSVQPLHVDRLVNSAANNALLIAETQIFEKISTCVEHSQRVRNVFARDRFSGVASSLKSKTSKASAGEGSSTKGSQHTVSKTAYSSP